MRYNRETYWNTAWTDPFFQVSTDIEHKNRIKQLFSYYDETLELYKGQIEYYELRELPYKEVLQLRENRFERYKEEKEKMEQERKQMEAERRKEMILRK